MIKRFPIPPSINKQLAFFKGRFIKTTEARIFDQKVQIFKLRNCKLLDEIKSSIKEKQNLKVDCYFIFHEKRLISKKSEIKTLDVNNYLKSALDGLVKCLEIDDKFFIAHHIEKLTCENESDEQIIFIINDFEIKKFDSKLFQ
jgi:Holliday junction resolvase RusA-like endonuclease